MPRARRTLHDETDDPMTNPREGDEAVDWRTQIDQTEGRALTAAEEQEAQEGEEVRNVTDRLRAVASKMGADRVRVKVYRRTRAGGLEWCRDYSPEEFVAGELDMVREEWGSGDYQIRAIGPRGVLMRENLTIAKPLDAAPNPRQSGSPELAQAIELLARGQERIIEALATRPDPAAQLQQTIALMVSMREAMGLNVPPPAPAPAANPTAMLSEIIGAVRQLREVAAEVTEPKADPTDPAAMLPMILDMVKSSQSAQPQMLAPVTVPPSFAQQSEQPTDVQIPQSFAEAMPETAPAMQPETVTMNPIQTLILRGLLNKLLGMARQGVPPAVAGEWIAEKIPDELLSYLELDTCADILISVAPEAAQYRDWLDASRQAALAALEGDDGAEGSDIPAGQ